MASWYSIGHVILNVVGSSFVRVTFVFQCFVQFLEKLACLGVKKHELYNFAHFSTHVPCMVAFYRPVSTMSVQQSLLRDAEGN